MNLASILIQMLALMKRTAKNSSNLPLAFEFLKALVNQEIADWVKEFALKIRFLLS